MLFLENLCQSVSEERLAPYKLDIDQDDNLVACGRYFWNAALSESMYPGLQGLEVALRNSLHTAISRHWGGNDWFDALLKTEELKALSETRNHLKRQRVPESVGQIVANSSLGFWVSLFNSRYEGILWPGLLKTVFPAMPNRLRTRRNLSSRLNKIRRLRNRIFHYEPIWKYPNLAQLHSEIWETIDWISPDTLAAVKQFDRFPEVHQLGPTHYQERISKYLNPEIPPPSRRAARADAVAPDGSEIRLLLDERHWRGGASMVEVTLTPGQVSRPVYHRTVGELWYILEGWGQVWRCPPDIAPAGVAASAVQPGDALTIPVGWRFQFSAAADSAAGLRFLCLTIPPWPGAEEAQPADYGGLGPATV